MFSVMAVFTISHASRTACAEPHFVSFSRLVWYGYSCPSPPHGQSMCSKKLLPLIWAVSITVNGMKFAFLSFCDRFPPSSLLMGVVNLGTDWPEIEKNVAP